MKENKGMSKNNWVMLFKEAGMTEDMMHKWHFLYERNYPESHQSFLAWLGLSEKEIAGIRKKFKP